LALEHFQLITVREWFEGYFFYTKLYKCLVDS